MKFEIDLRENIRIILLVVMALGLFVMLGNRLFELTVVQGEEYAEASDTRKYRVLTTTGTRGIIMDAHGIPLAYDQKCYDVVFYKDASRTSSADRAYYTNILIKAIDIIEENGGTVVDTFSITRDGVTGDYRYDFGDVSAEAQAKREARWRSDMYVSTATYDDDPELVYNVLRERYQIPTELPYDEARKLLSVWQQLQLNTSKSYLSVDLAYDVDIQTVAILKAAANELEGIDVEESTTRVYPRADVAAHVVGYLGKISDPDKLTEYEELGYPTDSWVGVSGVEGYLESVLSPNTSERQGTKEVEVNSRGQITSLLSETEAKAGNSVMLTVDLNLQMAVEDALQNGIEQIAQMQKEHYEENRESVDKKVGYDEQLETLGQEEIKWANSGAAVVMDVNTGKVLAMASYPSYDLNLFTGGIAEEDYDALLADPATPLYNKAVSAKATPGSIFKMVTALGALMDGDITTTERISDMGEYTSALSQSTGAVYYGHIPRCWVWPYITKHADQTLSDGLKNSCNYFFYTLAERMGIDRINYWASELGLDQKTGIEILNESTGQIGGQGVLYDTEKELSSQKSSIPVLVYRRLKVFLQGIGTERGVEYSETDLIAATEALMAIETNITNTIPYIRDVLEEHLDISTNITASRGWDQYIRDLLTELRWNPIRTILVGIGQEPVLVTPVAIARYVSAIANGGTVYNASVVDKMIAPDGSVVDTVEPSVYNEIVIPEQYIKAIQTGMEQVVDTTAGGTAGSVFEGWEYVSQVAGKTGTAQVSQIDLENNAWFVSYVPKDDPEVAIVVYVPNGWKASNATIPAKDIIAYYLEHRETAVDVDIPTVNSVIAPFEWDLTSELFAEKQQTAGEGDEPEDETDSEPLG